MRRTVWLWWAVACSGEPPECDLRDRIAVYADTDGDGFGAAPMGQVCNVGAGQSEVATDCDDTDPARFPGAEELCNNVDDDCDGGLDEDAFPAEWYRDEDGDGWGGAWSQQLSCSPLGDGWVRRDGDCNDDDASISPDAAEVCNGNVDDDCDGLTDDFDEDTDPASMTTFWLDRDGDGWGDKDWETLSCYRPADAAAQEGDCNDQEFAITRVDVWEDADGDGYGNADLPDSLCNVLEGYADNPDDCDDTDADIIEPRDWYVDGDSDGYGSGASLGLSCVGPQADAAPAGGDCNESNPNIHPNAVDPCDDGKDWNCDSRDTCATCADVLAGDPSAASGVYSVTTTDAGPVDVLCEMDVDGGGWTLVGSSKGSPLDDQGTDTLYPDLVRPAPISANTSLWRGVVGDLPLNSDLRFVCSLNVLQPAPTVDLTFYDVPWYREIVASDTDYDVCFNDGSSALSEDPPMRRNNRTGAVKELGDRWNFVGYLSSESSCGDYGSFAVDFDDGGVQGGLDGTDWGESGYSPRCGNQFAGSTAAWYVFVR